MNDEVDQFKIVAELIESAVQTGEIRDPLICDELDLAQSPLKNGAVAKRFQRGLSRYLSPRVIAMALQGPPPATYPDPPVNRRVVPGIDVSRDRPLPISYQSLNRHMLVLGPTGCGKSTLEALIIKDLLGNDAMVVEYYDTKGEGRRLLNQFPGDTLVFRADQEPVNHMAPVGPVERFCWDWMAELTKLSALHPATWPEAAEILVRVHHGLKPGDPPPSLVDCQRLFQRLAEDGNAKFFSVAGALRELCSTLGRTAFIRRAPSLDGVARVIVHDYAGIPPKLRAFFIASRFMRIQTEAAVEGREADQLRRVIIFDEGQEAFGKELSQVAGSGYIAPQKRFLMQGRSTGTSILSSIQSLFGVDETLPGNTDNVVVFKCPDYDLAVKAAQLLGDSRLAPDIQNLGERHAYVRSSGFTGPVRIRVQNFNLGRYRSDAEVEQRQAAKLEVLTAQTEYTPDHPEQHPTMDYLDILGERPANITISLPTQVNQIPQNFLAEHRAFLRDVAAHPTYSVTQHYVSLKLGSGHGNRLKNQLLKMGLIRVERQRSAGGRPVEILFLTEASKGLIQ